MAPTDRQINFVRSLLADRVVGECLRVEAEEALDRGDRREVSAIIDRLKECPFPPREGNRVAGANPRIEVAEGRYALPSDYDPEGTPVFYKVDHGAEGGRWEGYIFLSRLVGPNEAPIKDRDERSRILSQIAGERIEALRRYGHLAGHCGNCGLELTDKFSRFVGVGPVCREKLGLPKSEAAFVKDGGILPDEYLREVAAEEEAALRAAGVPGNDGRCLADGSLYSGLPAGAPGSRHPLGPDAIAAINERIAEGGEVNEVEADLREIRRTENATAERLRHGRERGLVATEHAGGVTVAHYEDGRTEVSADGRPVNTGNADLRALAARFGGGVAA